MAPPGFKSPFASASSTIAMAMRSLTDPPGLNDSTLASSVAGQSAAMCRKRTIGVFPTVSRIVSTICGGVLGAAGESVSVVFFGVISGLGESECDNVP